MKEHLVHMMRDRAGRYGSREVLRYKGSNGYQSMSWEQLIMETENVSRALLQIGFGFGDNIGIFSNNMPEWTITDLAILGIRGVVVPFFGTATKEQVKYIVDETQMKLMFVGNPEQLEKAIWVLDHTATLEKIIIFKSDIGLNDHRCANFQAFKESDADRKFESRFYKILEEVQPDDLATIIYTSGTTGEPKGVMLGHDNFMYCFGFHDKRLDLTEKDVSMCFLPLSHIFERTWTYLIFHTGGTNIYLENPREVITELPLTNPTVMCTVPRFFEKTHEGIQHEYHNWPTYKQHIFDWSIGVGHRNTEYIRKNKKTPFFLNLKRRIAELLVLKKLRNIFGKNMRSMPCSGAAIRIDLLKFFHATGLFVNYGYGATETTASVSCFKKNDFDFTSVGTVMPDIEVKIDDNGEILVKGKTLFKGYYKKPMETLEALKDGWYRTGDEGRLSEDGKLVMTDRIKDLMKTSVGKYVSPQRIELLLGQDPMIEQVIVLGDNRKYVSALIVPELKSLRLYAKNLGLKLESDHHLVNRKEIQELFKNRIETLQKELSSYEKVVKFTLLHEPFSVENNAMTSTLKFRRKVIAENYKLQIEEMY